MILSFILVVQPCNIYAHYGFILIPTYIYPICILIDFLYQSLYP
jgi:hypothetical protein